MTDFKTALIVGAGDGLSAALARLFTDNGLQVALAARNIDKLQSLKDKLGAHTFQCDASQVDSVLQLFNAVDASLGARDVVVYNPSYRTRGPIAELDPAAVQQALMVTAYGGFLVGQQATKRMEATGKGAILFTGASASVKGYPHSAPFAMGKFALRGLVQSMARELAPKNIHVAHFIIDGAILPPGQQQPTDSPDRFLEPNEIATSYWHVLQQHRSTWTWEMELRPWVERF
ncbi:SDR family NAD(P)-dependent oxidoreductase [Leptothoe spongobia]|uniref:SDR family NAD(P)-dependent oxidoreductase n=1 Tax=Leptothoe spongobia TAU-MAC 1115 TaxID=1967444 RepID=A0A947DFM7_9CYAN|nr:SDR family NAD(P)-dependent oxidoreductase [Leptothoe spongobia]MBT9315539.1 SDR family NAD(P)-dependent oxidoreductase [Leptothoe spongobia TAU-MAC 1115]